MLFIYNQKSEIFKLHLFPDEAVCADDDIYLALAQCGQGFFLFGRRLETIDIIDRTRKILKALCKGAVVLHRQDSCWNEYSDLLAVSYGFEGCPDGNLRFPESHIATDQAIHRMGLLHVVLYLIRTLELIRGVFVDKRSFEFCLQVIVGRKGMPCLRLPFGVEADEFIGYVFYLSLGFSFQLFPGIRSQLIDPWGFAVFAAVLADFVQGIDVDIEQVVIFVYQPYGFLCFAVYFNFFEPRKTPHPMVNVHHIIAR